VAAAVTGAAPNGSGNPDPIDDEDEVLNLLPDDENELLAPVPPSELKGGTADGPDPVGPNTPKPPLEPVVAWLDSEPPEVAPGHAAAAAGAEVWTGLVPVVGHGLVFN